MADIWRRTLAGLALLLLAPCGARAEEAVFDLSFRGFTIGTVRFQGEVAEGRYAVKGRLQSTGLLNLVRKIRYDGTASGSFNGGRFVPARYSEIADTGRRTSEAVMDYRRGVPQVKVYNPPRAAGEGSLDPAKQGGTVDPLTALFAALRDAPAGQECNLALTLFDGKRRSQVSLAKPQAVDGGVTCAGEYRRLAGFSASDMAEKTRFPFTVRLVPAGAGMMQVAGVDLESIYGNARLKRQ